MEDSSQYARGVVTERLLSLKNSRSGFISHVTKLQGELATLFDDVTQCKEATLKKNALDEAFQKCLEQCNLYISEIPATEDFEEQMQEARAKLSEIASRKKRSDQDYAKYLELCTDSMCSASEVASNTSKRSSSSSTLRKQEMIDLELCLLYTSDAADD